MTSLDCITITHSGQVHIAGYSEASNSRAVGQNGGHSQCQEDSNQTCMVDSTYKATMHQILSYEFMSVTVNPDMQSELLKMHIFKQACSTKHSNVWANTLQLRVALASSLLNKGTDYKLDMCSCSSMLSACKLIFKSIDGCRHVMFLEQNSPPT